MIDLWVVAVGFGLIPIGAGALYLGRESLRRYEGAVWGALAGALAFLALAHAGTDLLVGNSYFSQETESAVLSAAVAAGGVLMGFGLAWLLVIRGADAGRTPLPRVAWGGLAFLAIHSVTDGLVLGSAYAGPFPIGFPLDAVTVAGTLVHRLVEGALFAVPAIAAGWRAPKTWGLLTAGLLAVPAAYLPVALYAGTTPGSATTTLQGISLFAAGAEAAFGLVLLAAGYMTWLATEKRLRWPLYAGLGFLVLLLVHFTVE